MVVQACGPRYSVGWGRRIAWAWEVDAAVSCDRATASQPGCPSETLSQKKEKNKERIFPLIVSIQHHTKILAKEIRQENKIKGIK